MGREVVAAATGGKRDFGPWEEIFQGEFDGRRRKRFLIKEYSFLKRRICFLNVIRKYSDRIPRSSRNPKKRKRNPFPRATIGTNIAISKSIMAFQGGSMGPERRTIPGGFLALFFVFILFTMGIAESAGAEDRQIVTGPFSFSVRGGAENNSEAVGFDGRIDYLNPFLNFHAFATYDWLNAGRGAGEIDNKRYGAGVALSHTYNKKANAFMGTAFIRDFGESFGHAYVGGKVKVADHALFSGAYGFGFGNEKEVRKLTGIRITAESADWLKTGFVLATPSGWKANAYYYLTDPGDLNISGIEGELSYALLDSLTIGLGGSRDLTEKTDQIRNWRAFLSLTYAIGDQKESLIDLALDKNNPVEYPRIVRVMKKEAAPSTPSPLAITPTNANALGCSGGDNLLFTASGGTPPYSWSTSDTSQNLVPSPPNQAVWEDSADDWCGSSGTVTITLTDAVNASVQAFIAVGGPT